MRPWWFVLVLASTGCAEEISPTVKAPPTSGFGLRAENAPPPLPTPSATVPSPVPEAPAALVPTPPAVAAAPPRLPESASTAGVGWFCFKSTRSDHGSVCGRTRADCEGGRHLFLKDGVPTTSCEAQGTAACFTCVDRLQQTKSTYCSAKFSDCGQQRAYQLEQKADVSDVSDCGPVK